MLSELILFAGEVVTDLNYLKKKGSHIHQTQAAHEPTIQLCVFDAAKKGSKLGGSIEPLLNPGSIAVLTVKKVPSRY